MLVDSPPAVPVEQEPVGAVAGPPSEPLGAPAPAPADQTCAKCGAPMALGQDWCLQCGAGARGSLGLSSARSAATILGVTAVLVLGAAAAGYAALSKGKHRPATVTTTVAQTTTPAPATPGVTTPVTPGSPSAGTPGLTLPRVKPPKIPLSTRTPKFPSTTTLKFPSATSPISPSTGAPSNTSTTTTPAIAPSGGATTPESLPAAILLDTNAASTYNPYSYPASDFGDPSLAIDGDNATAWTARVEPASAPKMAEGVLINLKSRRKLSAIKLVTSTPGMTVQVFGANGHTAPASITDRAWVALSRYEVVKKKHLRITLRDSNTAFSFVTLWISHAPAASVGTPEAPGHVSVNEIELFPVG